MVLSVCLNFLSQRTTQRILKFDDFEIIPIFVLLVILNIYLSETYVCIRIRTSLGQIGLSVERN